MTRGRNVLTLLALFVALVLGLALSGNAGYAIVAALVGTVVLTILAATASSRV